VSIAYAELYYGSKRIRFDGREGSGSDGLAISDEGVEGWYSTPEFKVDLLERGGGNGAHDIPVSGIRYASRVVTLHFYALGDERGGVLDAIDRVARSTGLPVRLRLVDDWSDTFVQGFTRADFEAGWHADYNTGSLTVECPRPERLGWRLNRVQLFGARVKPGGLSFGDGGAGLVFPLQFTDGGDDGGVDSIVNAGSFESYPLISVTGSFSSGILIQHDQGALEWSGNIGGSPLILDCSPRAHTATMGGVDVSRNLKRRDFPVIPADGSVSLRVMSAGSGWVTVESRDTYM
jgi:hypothetical protein